MATFVFKNGKSKRLHFRQIEDDIVLTTPDEPGIILTTNTSDEATTTIDQDPEHLEKIFASYILKPDIGNNGGVRNENANINPIKRAAYITSRNYIGLLDYTEWEAYADEDLTQLIDSSSLELHKNYWFPVVETLGTDVYTRYRFHSGVLQSPWSDIIHFKTPKVAIEPFTIEVEDSISPLISTSGFVFNGETIVGKTNHIATTYKVYDLITDKLVYSSEDNTVDLTEHRIPKGILKSKMPYLVEVFYTTDNELVGDSLVANKTFTTPDIKIETPVIQYKNCLDPHEDPHKIELGHYLEASKFSSGDPNIEHTSTIWRIYAVNENGKRLVFSVEEFGNLTSLNITNYLTDVETNLRAEVIYKSGDIISNPGILTFTKEDTIPDVKVTLDVEDTIWCYLESSYSGALYIG